MRYREYRPGPALAPFVRVLWTLEHRGEAGADDRILPDGCMELVFHLGQPFRALDDTGRPVVQPTAFLVGQMTSALCVRPSFDARVVGVRFRPGGAFPFLRRPQHELTGALPALDDVWPALARERERLAELPDMAAVAARVDAVLSRAATRARSPDRRLAASVAAIGASDGAVSVDRLAVLCGLGSRQLERLFRDQVGLGPKRLARIVRFQAGWRLHDNGASLASAAHAAGYADQAHFTREFKAIAGLTPSAFAAGEDPLAAAFAGGAPDVGFVQDPGAAGA
jgi:AraC-like DNA-binding protein